MYIDGAVVSALVGFQSVREDNISLTKQNERELN